MCAAVPAWHVALSSCSTHCSAIAAHDRCIMSVISTNNNHRQLCMLITGTCVMITSVQRDDSCMQLLSSHRSAARYTHHFQWQRHLVCLPHSPDLRPALQLYQPLNLLPHFAQDSGTAQALKVTAAAFELAGPFPIAVSRCLSCCWWLATSIRACCSASSSIFNHIIPSSAQLWSPPSASPATRFCWRLQLQAAAAADTAAATHFSAGYSPRAFYKSVLCTRLLMLQCLLHYI